MRRSSDRVIWILGGVLVVSLIGVVIGAAKMLGYDPSRGPSHALVGRAAPALDLPVVAGEGAGDRVSLAALEGQVVLLDFWASWCVPCRRSIPILNEVQERYGPRIAMYGVNVDTALTRERLVAVHAEFGADFPSVHDGRLESQTDYQVVSIPTLVLIDRAGVVRWVHRGVPDADDVGDRIEELLAP